MSDHVRASGSASRGESGTSSTDRDQGTGAPASETEAAGGGGAQAVRVSPEEAKSGYDFFLAYPGADAPRAQALRRLLIGQGYSVFLDSEAPEVLGRPLDDIGGAQRRSRVSVVLVSAASARSFYDRVEIHEAIALLRTPGSQHRVVPVYLDGDRIPSEVPYGLRCLVSLVVAHVGGLDGVAARLDQMMRRLYAEEPRYPDAVSRAQGERLAQATRRSLAARAAGPSSEGEGEALAKEAQAARQALRKNGAPCTGDVLGGRYQLWEKLGEGGFAIVWCARDLEREEKVAVRVLRTGVDGERRERFFLGAREQAGLHHPGVARVLVPEGEDQGLHYMVMEYLEGKDLGEAVGEGRIRGLEAVPLLVAMGEALDYAHKNGLIHRDVKPTNILLDHAGAAHLTDFDLVRAGDTTGGTRTGMMGTLVYAAPEALDRPGAVTRAADVFSLGMTALFCLHGKELPLTAFKRPEAFIAKLQVNRRIKQVLEKAVREEPGQRYDSCGAFCAALAAAAARRSGAAFLGAAAAVGVIAVLMGVLFAPKWFGSQAGTGVTRDAGQIQSAARPAPQGPAPVVAPPPSPVAPPLDAALVELPGGTFQLGRDLKPGEKVKDATDTPAHAIYVAPFALQWREVTKAEYRPFQEREHLAPPWSTQLPWEKIKDLPVTNVSALEAERYCASRFAGGRLPKETEWEWAAREGLAERRYPWPGVYDATEVAKGSFSPETLNETPSYHIANLAGNAREWTASRPEPYPGTRAVVAVDARLRVVRGGSYEDVGTKDRRRPAYVRLRATTRVFLEARARDRQTGFRCAADLLK